MAKNAVFLRSDEGGRHKTNILGLAVWSAGSQEYSNNAPSRTPHSHHCLYGYLLCSIYVLLYLLYLWYFANRFTKKVIMKTNIDVELLNYLFQLATYAMYGYCLAKLLHWVFPNPKKKGGKTTNV